MNLCTVLIPSRGRVEQLFRCIDSICESAVSGDYGISIRLDDNDYPTLGRIDELRSYPMVHVDVGVQPTYESLDRDVYTPMARAAESLWVWIFNDDMTVIGRGWDSRLAEVPETGYWCQPEIHRLNNSHYPKDEEGCAPFFINDCWRTLKISDDLPGPCDRVLVSELRKQGWKAWFLDDITVFHDRNK